VSDPGYAIQVALVTTLKATGGIGTDDRVYDRVPDKPSFPYVTVGDDLVIGDDVECGELSEVFCRIHVWSRAQNGGFPEAKTIAGAIRARLRAIPPAPTGFTILETKFVQTQSLIDPDGLTRHVVLEFHFLIQHN
jgi:hypothetical protein